tara:strand:- start:47735 stop:47929 length:195 start_codon:yes stop_codon:yes gene_type:complete
MSDVMEEIAALVMVEPVDPLDVPGFFLFRESIIKLGDSEERGNGLVYSNPESKRPAVASLIAFT